MPQINWKCCPDLLPRPVVQGIPVDKNGSILVMHRSSRVRSAANVWSFPSGLHDIGETRQQCISRELHEEYGLDALACIDIGTYENIAGDAPGLEQYHWVISVVGVLVEDVTQALNKEPNKHDRMEFKLCTWLDSFDIDLYPFHISFERWFVPRRNAVTQALFTLAKDAP